MNFSLLFVLLNFSLLHLYIFQQANAVSVKDVRIQKASDCTPDGAKYTVRVENVNVNFLENNTFRATGQFTLFEQLPMNLELEVSITRCNLDYTGCSKYGAITFPRICEKISVKTSIAYKIARGIHPTPKCPVPPGNYKIDNDSTFLLNTLLSLPTDGYLWNAQLMFYEKRGLKRVRPLACINVDLIANSKKMKM